MSVVDLVEVASMWLTINVSMDDVEHERQQLEAKFGRRIEIHDSEIVTRSGVRMLRVEWKYV
jgi:hypothetical protein